MTEEVQEPEVETQEVNPIEDLVNQITAGELNKAEGSFNSIIQDKMTDALEAQRIAIAQGMFDTPEGLGDGDEDEDIVDETIEDEDEDDDIEISDEEIEAAIDTVMDEDEEILAALDDDDYDEEEE